jgi:hypothetical protein
MPRPVRRRRPRLSLTIEQRRRLRDLLTLVVYDKAGLFNVPTREDLSAVLIAIDNSIEPEADEARATRLRRYDIQRPAASITPRSQRGFIDSARSAGWTISRLPHHTIIQP